MLFAIICVCRVKVGDAILYDALIVTIGVTVYQYVDGFKSIKKFLEFLGRHSMDMFLTHTFLFFLWPSTHKIVYATSNPLVIYVTGVTLSLMLALGIEKIKNVIDINKIISKLRTI